MAVPHLKALTIKNVILDSSCSITSSFSGTGYAHIGGIIGYCWATIENSVNMGSVTFTGNVSDGYYLYLGGIVGYLDSSSSYDTTVKNCANYGDVTHYGKSSSSYIGGIVGYSNRVYIYNYLNYASIYHVDTTSNILRLGGIAGNTEYTTIDNCVSGGEISSHATEPDENYIGSIVGRVDSNTTINYCYWTSDLSDFDKYGTGAPASESNTFSYDSTTFELSETVSIGSYTGTSLIEALNGYSVYYKDRGYSQWLLINREYKAVSFTINGRTNPIKMDHQIILLPSLASEGNMNFDGWYTDKECTVPFEKTAVEEDTTLYGKYESEKSLAPSLFPYATLLLSFLISLVAF